ncbi:MAG: AI-2E family transporter [Candidatus Methylacidiphilales bacterium]
MSVNPSESQATPAVSEGLSGSRIVTVLAAVVIVIAGLKLAAPILIPFFLALFLAILSFPILFWLKGKGSPTWLAIVVSVLVNFAVVTFIALMALQSVSNFQARAPLYLEKFEHMVRSVQARFMDGSIPGSKYFTLDLINPGAFLEIAQSTLGQVMSVLSSGFLVFLFMIFIMGEASTIPEKIRFIMGARDESDPGRFQKITQEIVQYLGIKTLVSLGTGLVIGLGVYFLGLDFPVMWGLTAFALNYVPTIGSILASIPALILAVVQPGTEALATAGNPELFIDWGRVLGVGLVYLCTNILFGNFIEPMWMGKKLGLSTLVVTVSLVFWGWVWGPIGMLLSVPLTMVVKIMLENTPDMRWAAVLLAQWPVDQELLKEVSVPVPHEDQAGKEDS